MSDEESQRQCWAVERPSDPEAARLIERGRVYPPAVSASSAWIGDRPDRVLPVDPHPVLHWGSTEWLEMERRQQEERARLVEAATYLRDLAGRAGRAAGGEWRLVRRDTWTFDVVEDRDDRVVAQVYDSELAAWISAMPLSVVGLAVAEWLESVAGSLEVDEPANAAAEAEQLAESLLRHKARST